MGNTTNICKVLSADGSMPTVTTHKEVSVEYPPLTTPLHRYFHAPTPALKEYAHLEQRGNDKG